MLLSPNNRNSHRGNGVVCSSDAEHNVNSHRGNGVGCSSDAEHGLQTADVEISNVESEPRPSFYVDERLDPFWEEEIEPEVEGPKPKDILTPSSTKVANYELFLSWAAISIAAYAGSYIRVGLSSWRIWNMDTDMTSIYAQILGCVIMGFVTHHKNFFFNTSSRCIKVIYLGLTSGLCGSITTFSTLNILCNQACFFDSALINGPNITGARIAAWAVCLWVGIAISLKSLHLGHQLALLSPRSNSHLAPITAASPKSNHAPITDAAHAAPTTAASVKTNHPAPPPPPPLITEAIMEFLLIAAYIITTSLVLALPAALGRPELTYTAAFGACGAFLRFLLSLHNPRISHFPIGTFTANVVSTWILAAVAAARARAGGASAPAAAAALYGVTYGFCGCLSTISTLVNEIDSLPAAAAYRYGLATFAAAHLGVLLCYDIPLLAVRA